MRRELEGKPRELQEAASKGNSERVAALLAEDASLLEACTQPVSGLDQVGSAGCQDVRVFELSSARAIAHDCLHGQHSSDVLHA